MTALKNDVAVITKELREITAEAHTKAIISLKRLDKHLDTSKADLRAIRLAKDCLYDAADEIGALDEIPY